MGLALTKKRSAQSAPGSSKRRKIVPDQSAKGDLSTRKGTVKPNKKDRLSQRPFIPIPAADEGADDDNAELSEEDLDLLQEYGESVGFLHSLDQNAISRSKHEIERLYQQNKPARKAPPVDDLPSVNSHESEDEDDWSSGFGDVDDTLSDSGSQESSLSDTDLPPRELDSDAEMPYELLPRQRRLSWNSEQEKHVQGLPIKLSDGRVQQTGKKTISDLKISDSDNESDRVPDRYEAPRVEDVSTGARFGRPAVVDVITNKSRKARIQVAKDQIAGICQEIIADPENSLGLLRRLHTFSLEKISTPSQPDAVVNDVIIRKLAILSQLAVFKDIIPGYRIRALTDKEKAEKVSQIVAHTRDWEQGLVTVYQSYLRSLEAELKARSELADIALQCMCTLATELTHFNFRVNLMTCIVARLSKKSWDKSSDLCLKTIITIFREDLTAVPSLEIVQLLNRMIKERKFSVHPEVLSCLLYLRLKTELGVRASESKADRDEKHEGLPKRRFAAKRAKGKASSQPHLNKKMRKALKERQEIEREFRDAEAELDKEDRAKTQTETLKLLFVLYFRILKNSHSTPLLPAALQGISKFAHLVNVDFFKDLMQVLKDLITRESADVAGEDGLAMQNPPNLRETYHQLLCISTAFELLSGQGEALTIDLSDFVNHLYAIILPVSLLPEVDVPSLALGLSSRASRPQGITDLLFKTLTIVFSPKTSGTSAPPWRAAAFAKRLLIASLNWPPRTVVRTLEFIRGLLAKESKLEALLSTEDRTADGIYRAEIDDPQLCHPFGASFWELHLLRQHHYDADVKDAALKLAAYSR